MRPTNKLENQLEMADLYAVLGAEAHQSHAELKALYVELARQLHPDKRAQEPAGSGTGSVGDGGAAFLRVQEAWEVLRDEAKRRDYDAKVRAENGAPAAAAEVDLDDLGFRDGVFTHKCRCGDEIRVTEANLDDGCDVFECPSCSLKIRVLFEKVS